MPFDGDPKLYATVLPPIPVPADTPHGRLIQLRDFLAALPDSRFNMDYWCEDISAWDQADLMEETGGRPQCGTIACIGGWADVLAGVRRNEGTTVQTGERLGLDQWRAHDLFHPGPLQVPWGTIPVARAVRVLDHLIETGEVDWSIE